MSHTPPAGSTRRCRRCGGEYTVTEKHESGPRCPACRLTSGLPQDAEFVLRDERAADRYVHAFDEEWRAWRRYHDPPVWRSSNWRASVRTWRRYGLDLDVLLDLVEQALTKDDISGSRWRYLCASCWHHLREHGQMPKRKRKPKPGPRMPERILAALAGGQLRRIELSAELGCHDDDGGFTRALRQLEAQGRIVRPRRGVYALAEVVLPAPSLSNTRK